MSEDEVQKLRGILTANTDQVIAALDDDALEALGELFVAVDVLGAILVNRGTPPKQVPGFIVAAVVTRMLVA